MAAATYSMIKNGRGFLYASGGNLYKQVKKEAMLSTWSATLFRATGQQKYKEMNSSLV